MATAFLFTALHKASFIRAVNKKAGHFVPGFSIVEKRFEISNLDLIRDIDYIFKLGKDLSLMR